jgi:hypothetical protein
MLSSWKTKNAPDFAETFFVIVVYFFFFLATGLAFGFALAGAGFLATGLAFLAAGLTTFTGFAFAGLPLLRVSQVSLLFSRA